MKNRSTDRYRAYAPPGTRDIVRQVTALPKRYMFPLPIRGRNGNRCLSSGSGNEQATQEQP